MWGSTAGLDKELKALYAAYPDLKAKYIIKPVLGGAGDTDVANKLRLQLAARSNIPDIVQLNYSGLPQFATQGVLADLTGPMKRFSVNMTPAARKLSTYKGKMFAVPYEVKTKLWFFRKDMFDAAGINPASIRSTADFIAAGKKLHAKYPNSYIWNLGTPMAGYNLGEILSGNGARFSDEQGKFVIASDPGVRKAFQDLKALKDSGVIANIADWTPQWQKGLADDGLASTLIGNWFTQFLPQYAPALAGKWSVTTWPTIAGASGGSEAAGSINVVPDAAPNKAAAIDILTKLFLTTKGNLALYHEMGLMPLTTSALNSPETLQADPYFGSALPKVQRAALKGYKVFNFDPAALQEFALVQASLEQYLSGALTLDAALNVAQQAAESQIGNPYQK